MGDRKFEADIRELRKLIGAELDTIEAKVNHALDTGAENYDQLLARVQVSDRTVQLLQEQVRVAQNREKELMQTCSDKDSQIARLMARLQIIKDQTDEAEIGGNIADRLARGEPAFNIIERGAPMDSVLRDIQTAVEDEVAIQNGTKQPSPLGRLARLLKGESETAPALPAEPMPEFPDEVRRIEA